MGGTFNIHADKMHTKFQSGNLEERDQLGELASRKDVVPVHN